jgi:hypothetical protein
MDARAASAKASPVPLARSAAEVSGVGGKPAYGENLTHINKSVRYGISGMSAGGIG